MSGSGWGGTSCKRATRRESYARRAGETRFLGSACDSRSTGRLHLLANRVAAVRPDSITRRAVEVPPSSPHPAHTGVENVELEELLAGAPAGDPVSRADPNLDRPPAPARRAKRPRGGARLSAAGGAFARNRWAPIVVLFGFSMLISLFVWPGHLDADALKQIQEAQTGRFTDWWSPIIDWMMRGLFQLGGGPGVVLECTIFVALVAIYQLLRVRLSRWWAVLATMGITVFPPVLGYLTALQRDVWFGSTALMTYALLVRAARSSKRARRVWAVISLVSVWLAMAARQNAIPALIPGVVIALLMISRPESFGPASAGPPATPDVPATPEVPATPDVPATPELIVKRAKHRRSWGRPAVIALLTVVVFGVFYESQSVLTYDVIGAGHVYPQQELFEQDLAGISLREGVDLIPRSIFPAHSLTVLRRYYTPGTVIPLVEGTGHPLVTYAKAPAYHQLEKAWEQAIIHHPVGYFHARWNLWMAEIDWNTNSWAPYHPGIDKNPLGLHLAFPVLDRFVLAYLSSFATPGLRGGILTRAWIYLLIAPFLGWSLIRRRRSFQVRIVGFMELAAFVYTLTFAVAAMGETFRWNWFLVTATSVALVVQAVESYESAVERRVQRRLAAIAPVH